MATVECIDGVTCLQEPTSSGHQRSTASLQLPPVQQSARQALDAARSSAQKDGCIDLLDATDAGVRALEAADRQVDTASNDTALATALAEKADLERKLKVCCLLFKSVIRLLSSGAVHFQKLLRAACMPSSAQDSLHAALHRFA